MVRMQVTTLREQMTTTDDMFASDGCEVFYPETGSYAGFLYIIVIVVVELLYSVCGNMNIDAFILLVSRVEVQITSQVLRNVFAETS